MKKKIDSSKKSILAARKTFAIYQKITATICVHLWIILLCLSASAQTKQPKTARDFFMLLPDKYFGVLCCADDTKESYLKQFLDVEDTANGYLSGNAEGGQGGFKMALFKRPNGNYLIGFHSFGVMWDDFYFLEYKNKKWTDVSAREVPGYSKANEYVMPRYGTTDEVFSRKLIEKEDDFEIRERDQKIYDLEWKNGKFQKRK